MCLEFLESRRLLAVTVTTGLNKIVRIAGTGGDDTVSVALLSGARLRISDGTANTDLNLTDVKRLTFIGGNGNDSITIGRVPIRCYIDGGAGDDTVSTNSLSLGKDSLSGTLDDTIIGGRGNDYLFGGGGFDTLNGGDGTDTLIGGTGTDNLIGDAGADLLVGGNEVDYLFAQSESGTNDTLIGGDGVDLAQFDAYGHGITIHVGRPDDDPATVDDAVAGDVEYIYGTPYADRIEAYTGRRGTYISAGQGNDTIVTGSGNDTISGGAGRDSIISGPGDDRINPAGPLSRDDMEADTVVGGSGIDYVYAFDNDVLSTTEGDLIFQPYDNDNPDFGFYYGPDGDSPNVQF